MTVSSGLTTGRYSWMKKPNDVKKSLVHCSLFNPAVYLLKFLCCFLQICISSCSFSLFEFSKLTAFEFLNALWLLQRWEVPSPSLLLRWLCVSTLQLILELVFIGKTTMFLGLRLLQAIYDRYSRFWLFAFRKLFLLCLSYVIGKSYS